MKTQICVLEGTNQNGYTVGDRDAEARKTNWKTAAVVQLR